MDTTITRDVFVKRLKTHLYRLAYVDSRAPAPTIPRSLDGHMARHQLSTY